MLENTVLEDGIMVYTVKKDLHGEGIVMVQTFQTALKQYTKWKEKDLRLLMQYATKFRVDKISRQYLKMLL